MAVETVAVFAGSLWETAITVTFVGAAEVALRVTWTGTAIDSPNFIATSSF